MGEGMINANPRAITCAHKQTTAKPLHLFSSEPQHAMAHDNDQGRAHFLNPTAPRECADGRHEQSARWSNVTRHLGVKSTQTHIGRANARRIWVALLILQLWGNLEDGRGATVG